MMAWSEGMPNTAPMQGNSPFKHNAIAIDIHSPLTLAPYIQNAIGCNSFTSDSI